MADQNYSTDLFAKLPTHHREMVRGVVILTLLVGISLTRIHSYLLFHSLAELFSVVVAFGVFIVAWNSAPLVKNNYLMTLGIGALFIALIDLVHTLAFKGMGVFTGSTANLPTQLWLAARYLQALTLLTAPLLFQRDIRRGGLTALFAIITTLLLASIFLGIFPTTYIEGSGLTSFKIVSEYVIIAFLLTAIGLLWRIRDKFDAVVLRWLISSFIFTSAAELAFTSYVGVTDAANLLGHIFKIIAFYLLYGAVVETGFIRPYALIFRNLKQVEQAERQARGEAEDQLEDLRSLSLQIMETMGQGLIVTDSEGRLEYVNPAFSKLAGLSPQKLIGRNSNEVNLVDKYSFLPQQGSGQLKIEKVYETTLLRADGKPIPVLVTSVPRLQEDLAEGTITVITDITQQKKSEVRLRQINRALTMLKDCNQVLVRTDKDAELMQSMCEIIVKIGGYRMAWIGFAEQDQAWSVRPMAQFGLDDNFLEQAGITWDDSERGRDPTGTAIREGTVQVNHNFLTNPKTILWRESAIKRGYQSSVSLPLQNKKSTFGALTVYAPAPDAFDVEELSLLTELADDMAYGITMLREREKRKRAEDALKKAHDELEVRVRERTEELAIVNKELMEDITRRIQLEAALKSSEEKANSLIKFAPTGIYEIDFNDNRFISVNEVVCQWTGYTREELLAIDPLNFISDADKPKFRARIESKLAGEEIDDFVEYTITARDGHEIHVELHVGPYTYDKSGKPETAFVIAHDITERKRAEEAMRAANAELTRFNNIMVGRELRMIELKKEVNELCVSTGQPPRYSMAFAKEEM